MSLLQRGTIWHSRILHEGKRHQKSLKVSSLIEARKLEAKWRLEIVTGEAGLGQRENRE